MRIMTILGSPRRQGNTAKVLGWIEEQFRADGHEADSAVSDGICGQPESTYRWSLPSVSQPRVNRAKVILR
jgi:NAD(P)H-dependent FMN reductase